MLCGASWVRSETANNVSPGTISRRTVSLDEIASEDSNCWRVDVIEIFGVGDDMVDPQRSTLELFENGIRLGPAHSEHQRIRDHGHGPFSHWNGYVYFSTTD